MRSPIKKSLLPVLLILSPALASAPAQAQLPAFLPTAESIEPGEATPADGTYVVSTINKRITIERGRAYVVDPWVHAFVLKVQSRMVVLKNFRQTGPDRFEAEDLPLMGPATLYRQPNGTLQVTVKGAMGEAKYALVPTDLVSNPGGDGPDDRPHQPAVERDRIYQLHVSGSRCEGQSLLRKRYRGVVRISVTDGNDDLQHSKSRNFDIRCTKKGPRSQNYLYYKNGPGSLTITIPPGAEGFTDLRVRGTIMDVLGPLDFNKDDSTLLQKAQALGRDLKVGEDIKDEIEIVGGKAQLKVTVTMKRTQ